MRIVALAFGAIALALCTAQAHGQRAEINYQGQAVISLEYPAEQGGTQSVRCDVLVSLGRPRTDGVQAENNPFNLVISAGQQTGMTLVSGDAFMTPSGGQVLVQFWKLELDGKRLRGRLVDAQANALPVNQLTVSKEIAPGVVTPSPAPMARGASLDGVIDAKQVRLTISGRCSECPFTVRLVAERQ